MNKVKKLYRTMGFALFALLVTQVANAGQISTSYAGAGQSCNAQTVCSSGRQIYCNSTVYQGQHGFCMVNGQDVVSCSVFDDHGGLISQGNDQCP